MRYNPWIEVNRAGQKPAAKPTPTVDFDVPINRQFIGLQAQDDSNATGRRYRP
ncbi:MAG: hypothetical protein OC190_15055 [Novosphingobium aromaticivorans]|jgi:hypothetical protein|nr:hypothetical protein [Novosphingobium aromaticivorans]